MNKKKEIKFCSADVSLLTQHLFEIIIQLKDISMANYNPRNPKIILNLEQILYKLNHGIFTLEEKEMDLLREYLLIRVKQLDEDRNQTDGALESANRLEELRQSLFQYY